ncbi:MAG: Nucleotide excision repair protein, with UvrB/UvrC motif, partial [uncultured Gemmatimonadetes bacterium]
AVRPVRKERSGHPPHADRGDAEHHPQPVRGVRRGAGAQPRPRGPAGERPPGRLPGPDGQGLRRGRGGPHAGHLPRVRPDPGGLQEDGPPGVRPLLDGAGHLAARPAAQAARRHPARGQGVPGHQPQRERPHRARGLAAPLALARRRGGGLRARRGAARPDPANGKCL